MKKFNKYLASLLVALSIVSISDIANAAFIDTVLYKWQTLTVTTSNGTASYTYDENHQYKDITFRNGYNYTQSSSDITSWGDMIALTKRIQYTRNFTTY